MKFIFIAALFVCFAPFVSARAEYIFADPFDRRGGVLILDIGNSQVIANHLAYPAEICGRADKNLCISSTAFTFSIPKKIGKVGTYWSDKEFSYTNTQQLEIKFQGLTRTVFQIESNRASDVYEFLYSRFYGLIGISIVAADSGKRATLQLQTKCGFGASPSCKNEQ